MYVGIRHAGRVSVVGVLERCGGVASRRLLLKQVSRHALERAVVVGDVVVDARGKYALPHADEAIRAAHRLTGVVSHRSAAAHWGWPQKSLPVKPELTVPRNRVVSPETRRSVLLHRTDLKPGEVDGLATTRDRTLVDVLRSCPFDEALAIADSALRSESFTPDGLARMAGAVRGPGSARVRRVAAAASGLAANPFESVLRAQALEVGLGLRPQVPLYGPEFLGRPDLVDVERRLIVEADSFEWHGSRAALRRDARRYNGFVLQGWVVLRFSWDDVMHHPDYVREALAIVADQGTERFRLFIVPA